MTNASATLAGAGFFGSGKRSGLARIWADYRVYRDTLAELRELTDRNLADLGMERAALKAIAHRSVYGN